MLEHSSVVLAVCLTSSWSGKVSHHSCLRSCALWIRFSSVCAWTHYSIRSDQISIHVHATERPLWQYDADPPTPPCLLTVLPRPAALYLCESITQLCLNPCALISENTLGNQDKDLREETWCSRLGSSMATEWPAALCRGQKVVCYKRLWHHSPWVCGWFCNCWLFTTTRYWHQLSFHYFSFDPQRVMLRKGQRAQALSSVQLWFTLMGIVASGASVLWDSHCKICMWVKFMWFLVHCVSRCGGQKPELVLTLNSPVHSCYINISTILDCTKLLYNRDKQ